MNQYSYEVFHATGENPCGKLALTFIQHPGIYGFECENVVYPDGRKPKWPENWRKCGSCGLPITPKDGETIHTHKVPRTHE